MFTDKMLNGWNELTELEQIKYITFIFSNDEWIFGKGVHNNFGDRMLYEAMMHYWGIVEETEVEENMKIADIYKNVVFAYLYSRYPLTEDNE